MSNNEHRNNTRCIEKNTLIKERNKSDCPTHIIIIYYLIIKAYLAFDALPEKRVPYTFDKNEINGVLGHLCTHIG